MFWLKKNAYWLLLNPYISRISCKFTFKNDKCTSKKRWLGCLLCLLLSWCDQTGIYIYSYPCSDRTQTAVRRFVLWSVLFHPNIRCSVFFFWFPGEEQSMYHAMGYSSMLVMQAGMTFDPKDVDAAMTSLRESLQTCQRWCTFCHPLFI